MLCTLHKLILKNNLRESQYLVTIKLISPVLTRFCCDFSKLKEYEKCYKILGIANNSDQETVRRAFIDLCKKYHPDSAKTTADTLKFHEVCIMLFRKVM